MEFIKQKFKEVILIKPVIFEDDRGYLFENYNYEKMKNQDIPLEFPLEFQSLSQRGVLRGLHFQKHPFAQGKLIRIIKGSVIDIVLDIRKKSPTFGQWDSFTLSAENKNMLWIPIGFAHGFLALEKNTIMHYKCTETYDKNSEEGIIWNDPDLLIDWKIKENNLKKPLLSIKDNNFSQLKKLPQTL